MAIRARPAALVFLHGLAVQLLGAPLVGLHKTAWKAEDSALFYRRLFRAALRCEGLAYANSLRRTVSAGLSEEELKGLICATGHTATACGPNLVAVVGGWRPECQFTYLHTLVIDIRNGALRVPELVEHSVKPPRRMRHASCAVETPAWAARQVPAGAPSDLPSVLALGGGCDGGGRGQEPPEGEDRGVPVAHGLMTLTLLTFCSAGESAGLDPVPCLGCDAPSLPPH